MSLKCSVFGHRFGDLKVTRQREERDSEAITTITETETCARCGETRVVSEHTNVTTREAPSENLADTPQDTDADANESGKPSLPDEPKTAGSDSQSRSETEGHIDAVESRGEPPAPPVSDGAETTNGSVGTPDPPADDDAVILTEASDTDDEAVSEGRAPGEWPDHGQEDDGDEEWIPDLTSVTETGMEGLPSVETDHSAGERLSTPVTVPEGDFHCPECGFTTTVESTSLRNGDFCPECYRGAIEQSLEE